MSEEQSTTEVVNETEDTTEVVNEKKSSSSGSAFYKQKLADAAAETAKLKQQLEEIQTNQLQEKENFKQLWENEKTKRQEAEEKNKSLSQTVFNNFKMSAIKEQAIKAGILDTAIEDLDVIDKSMVEVETTDRGTINVLGANEFVESLKERKPHWFRKLGAPTINNGTPQEVPPKTLSAADIIKLEKENPAQYQEIMKKRLSKS